MLVGNCVGVTTKSAGQSIIRRLIRLIGRLFFKLDEAGQNPASFYYFFWNHFWQNWFQICL